MELKYIKSILEKYQKALLAIPGVIGVSTGAYNYSGKRRFCIKVYLSKPVDSGKLEDNNLPKQLENVPIITSVTGNFIAY